MNESAFDFLGMYGCTYGKQELAQQRNNVQFLLASVNIAFEERKYILLFRAWNFDARPTLFYLPIVIKS